MFGLRTASLLRSSLGACSGVALGSSVLVQNEKSTSDWAITKGAAQKDGLILSRKITSPVDKLGLNLRLYQYQTCPYCSKVRAMLDYYLTNQQQLLADGFAYEVVEVNPVTRSQLKFAKGYRKVPVVTSSKTDQFLVESSQIISELYSLLVLKQRSLGDILDYYPQHTAVENGKDVTTYPNKYFVMRENQSMSDEEMQYAREERQWREWVDTHFVHVISPNVYRTWAESLETFRYFDKVGDWERNFPSWERYLAIYAGAAAMFMISKRLKKRHNIVDERQAMLDSCNAFLDAKGADRVFLGGDEPNLADLAFYGALTSFAGCKAFEEMREQCAIGSWFDAVAAAVAEHRGAKKLAARSQAA